ncbi:MAG: hypothetical protein KAS72_03525 [Phycisphaerales bacterium]|nr:hypothetical protein [Phycisphaerales bacterium]
MSTRYAARKSTHRGPFFEPLEARRLLSIEQYPVQVHLEARIIEVNDTGRAMWEDIDGDQIKLNVRWWNKNAGNTGVIGIDSGDNTEFITLDNAAKSVKISVKKQNGGDGRFELGQFWAPMIRQFKAPDVDYVGGSEHPFTGGLRIGVGDKMYVGRLCLATEVDVHAGGGSGLNMRLDSADTTGAFNIGGFTRSFRVEAEFRVDSANFTGGVGKFDARGGVSVTNGLEIADSLNGAFRRFAVDSLDSGEVRLLSYPRFIKLSDIGPDGTFSLPFGARMLKLGEVEGTVNADADTRTVKAGDVSGTLDLYSAKSITLGDLSGGLQLKHESQDANDYGASKIDIKGNMIDGWFNSQSSVKKFTISGVADNASIYLAVTPTFTRLDPIPLDGLDVFRPDSHVHLDKLQVKGRGEDYAMADTRILVPEADNLILGKLLEGNEVGQARFGTVRFLAEIPFVNHAFRGNDEAQNLRPELLVFITPHILDDAP